MFVTFVLSKSLKINLVRNLAIPTMLDFSWESFRWWIFVGCSFFLIFFVKLIFVPIKNRHNMITSPAPTKSDKIQQSPTIIAVFDDWLIKQICCSIKTSIFLVFQKFSKVFISYRHASIISLDLFFHRSFSNMTVNTWKDL